MNCRQIEAEGVIEQYVANKLTNAARKSFELHYFACDQCFGTLEAYQAGATALKLPRRTRRWVWPVGIAAAAVFVIIGLRPHGVTPKVEVAPLLAQIDPPAYSVPTLRAVPDKATLEFRVAMRPYERRDYPAAIQALKAFIGMSPKQERPVIDAEFFLGACYLLTDRNEEAFAVLEPVLASDSPYQEEAHFLVAEGWLKKGDSNRARTELEKVIGMGGDFKSRAQTLLAALNRP